MLNERRILREHREARFVRRPAGLVGRFILFPDAIGNHRLERLVKKSLRQF